MLNLNRITHKIENTALSPHANRISWDEVIPKPETTVTKFRTYVLTYMCPTFFKIVHLSNYLKWNILGNIH